jgi:predicted lipoprotein with Yx(FWY)xxD motif
MTISPSWVKRRSAWGASIAAVGVVAAACSSGYASTAAGAPASGGTGTPSPAQPAAATVGVGQSGLGAILVDGSGRSLYLFEKDTGTTSTCYDACAGYWPPALTSGTPQVTGTAVGTLVGTTARRDGQKQLTYAGHPLYYFVGDSKPGTASGEGLKNFGGGWYVLAPDGKKIDNG